MRTYTITVTREDNQWVAVAGGLPAGVVGALDFEHFSDVRDGMAEVIANLTDSEPDDFTTGTSTEGNPRRFG